MNDSSVAAAAPATAFVVAAEKTETQENNCDQATIGELEEIVLAGE
jgi:hypothetical protein